jgi:lipoyl(octanoyl) transferase
LTAQKRLAYDAVTRGDGRMTVLMCEHPGLITVGRRGSRDQLQLTGAELAERELTVRYVARGGGCLLHAPGQLAVYVITQLSWHGWSVGDYLRKLQQGVEDALHDCGAATCTLPQHFGLWGKTGLLAALGVAVKFGVTSQGVFINVDNDLRSSRRVETMSLTEYRPLAAEHCQLPERPIHSSLLCESSLPVKMASVRAAVVSQLAATFGCGNYQLHTSHPLLPEIPGSAARESAA